MATDYDKEQDRRIEANTNAIKMLVRYIREIRDHFEPIYGLAEKVPEKWKWSVPCDFTITIFEPNIVFMNQKQLEILIFHELLHIGVSVEDDKFFVVPHDLEDFKTIIKQYGPDWAESVPAFSGGSDND